MRRLTFVLPSSSFHPFFHSSFSVASHGRVPANVLLPIRCMPDSFERSCIMPAGFSVRSPGSSWVSAPRTLKPVTMASLTVINTASTHWRNDLARAIKALEQKKGILLGFGTADWFLFLHLRFDLAVVWLRCFALCKIIPNSSAHKLSAMMGHCHYGVTVSLVVWCCFAFAAWFVFGSVFCWFLFRFQ